jgi:hypothetical protein
MTMFLGENVMLSRCGIGSLVFAAAMALSLAGAQAHDESKYPDWNGQWRRPPGVNNQWDPTKPRGKEGAPLTAEFQAIFEANLKDQDEGGQGTDPTYTCIPDGMPRAMNVIFPMEMIILPSTTYMHIEYLQMFRRIYTDGRPFPEDTDTSFMGYSIGKWVDTDGDGRFDTLQVETRFLKSPRAFDSSGIPLHPDGKTIVYERFYQDKDKPDVLNDEVTTIDNALTRPWTVTKHYNRVRNPIWVEAICSENNDHMKIGKETYMRSADGLIMPAKKGQRPPDLRYFNMQDARK